MASSGIGWPSLLPSWLRLLRFHGRASLLGCRIDRGRRILSRPVRLVSAAPPTVLAVDDDPVVRDRLGIVLDEHCELVLAQDGFDAIETMCSRSVDAVLYALYVTR